MDRTSESNYYYPPPPPPQPYAPQQETHYPTPPQYQHQPEYQYQPQSYAAYGGDGAQQQNYQNVNMSGYAELGEPQSNTNDKITPSSGFKDVWATIVFLCQLAAFIGLSVVGLRTFNKQKGTYAGSHGNEDMFTLDINTVKIFGFSAVVGFGLSFLYLVIANIIPGPLILVTFIGSIILYFGITIYYFVAHYYSAAIVFLIFSVLYLLCFWLWRSRIPFATVMLKSVTAITRRYWSTIVTGILSLVIQTIYSIWFMLTVVGIYETYDEPNTSNSKLKVIMVFLVFSFYWTSQVISYVTHVTLAGVFATVYFLNDQVAHPIWASARRALTTSFGSICFGSLLVALINTVRYFIQVAKSQSDSALLSFFLCIIDCIISCIQGIFEWFNYYAFSGVAIYGQGFIPSAKRTWSIIQDRGVEALINDNLIGSVLFMGSLLVGMLSSLLGYIYLIVLKPSYNATGSMTPLIVFICFIMGMSMFSSVATVISSGVATIFVCLAEDPDALRRTNGELYEAIRQTWPAVVQGVY